MPRDFQMTPEFKGRHARWRKIYKGQLYFVNCAELGLPEDQWTERGSYQQANAWWTKKKAEIDGTDKPLPREAEKIRTTFKQRQRYAEGAGLEDEAQQYAAAVKNVEADPFTSSALDPKAASRLQALELAGFTLPEYLDPTTLNILLGASEQWGERMAKPKDDTPTMGTALDQWLNIVRVNAEASSIVTLSGYLRLFKDLKNKDRQILNDKMPVTVLNETKIVDVWTAIDALANDADTKVKKFVTFRSFVRWCVETGYVAQPLNLNSKRLTWEVTVKSKELPPMKDIKAFLTVLPDRLRLYCLLAWNTGMNNTDIGHLEPVAIDWKAGTLTRRRIKTKKWKGVPTVTYYMWAEVVRLLKQEMTEGNEYLLNDDKGKPLYITNKEGDGKVYDKIKCTLRDCKPLKAYTGAKFTVKDFRDFGSLQLQNSPHNRDWVAWLAHTPKEVHETNYAGRWDVTDACKYLEGLFKSM